MAALESSKANEGCIEDVSGTISNLTKALPLLRNEAFAKSEEVDLLDDLINDPGFLKLCEVNDQVACSLSIGQPEGTALQCIREMKAHAPYALDEETELMNLFDKSFLNSLLSAHDTVGKRAYEATLPTFDPNYRGGHQKRSGGPDIRTIGLHKNANEPLGITLKLISNKLVIARILYGGIIHRQGLLQVGDRILEVNDEPVDSMSPSDLQYLLKSCSGSVVIRVEPGFKENAGITDVFMKAHFDYTPKNDRLIPSQEAGLEFKKGDILRVLNQDDSFWWQAVKHDENQVAGLIPSRMLEERRKAFNSVDGRLPIGCMGRKKPKRKVMYSSHHCGEFEVYDMVLYEPVLSVDNFKYKTLVLIGAPNIGRRSLKTRLLAECPDKFADVIAHTTRQIRSEEDRRSFYFVTENAMREDIMMHRFIEFGKHRDHLYGIKASSIQDVLDDGKICVLDVHPQALKHLRTAKFCPLVVFIKAANVEGVRRLHQTARVDHQSGFSVLDEKDFEMCYQESCRIENIYSHYFDTVIVNENIDVAYEELVATIQLFNTGKSWVPTNWVI